MCPPSLVLRAHADTHLHIRAAVTTVVLGHSRGLRNEPHTFTHHCRSQRKAATTFWLWIALCWTVSGMESRNTWPFVLAPCTQCAAFRAHRCGCTKQPPPLSLSEGCSMVWVHPVFLQARPGEPRWFPLLGHREGPGCEHSCTLCVDVCLHCSQVDTPAWSCWVVGSIEEPPPSSLVAAPFPILISSV